MEKNNLSVIICAIWELIMIFSLALLAAFGKISEDTLMLGYVGCGIWLMLMNLYNEIHRNLHWISFFAKYVLENERRK